MNAAHAIERAEHALRTGQPNLACTYMSRASVLVAQDREAARRAILRARLNNARTPFAALTIAAEEISKAIGSTVDQIVQAFSPVFSNRAGYALAGPAKGAGK